MTHEEIVEKCLQFDANPPALYFLTTDQRTFKLGWVEQWWSNLNVGERYCVVKNQSYFLTEEEATAARDAIINSRKEIK